MLNFMRQLLGTFKALTAEDAAKKANLILTVRIVKRLAKDMACTNSLAGQIVGAMTINVDDKYYHADPVLFENLADELVRIMCILYDTYSKALGQDAALELIKAGAKDMTLTCSEG